MKEGGKERRSVERKKRKGEEKRRGMMGRKVREEIKKDWIFLNHTQTARQMDG